MTEGGVSSKLASRVVLESLPAEILGRVLEGAPTVAQVCVVLVGHKKWLAHLA